MPPNCGGGGGVIDAEMEKLHGRLMTTAKTVRMGRARGAKWGEGSSVVDRRSSVSSAREPRGRAVVAAAATPVARCGPEQSEREREGHDHGDGVASRTRDGWNKRLAFTPVVLHPADRRNDDGDDA